MTSKGWALLAVWTWCAGVCVTFGILMAVRENEREGTGLAALLWPVVLLVWVGWEVGHRFKPAKDKDANHAD